MISLAWMRFELVLLCSAYVMKAKILAFGATSCVLQGDVIDILHLLAWGKIMFEIFETNVRSGRYILINVLYIEHDGIYDGVIF